MEILGLSSWHVAGILFTALGTGLLVYASVVDSRRSNEHLAAQVQEIGAQIQDLRIDAATPDEAAKVRKVDEKYRAVAEEFFRSVPLRAAQEQARSAKQQVEEVQRRQEVEAYLLAVKREAERLAAAYNDSAGETLVEVESPRDPSSSQGHLVYLDLKFRGGKYWRVRVDSQDRLWALHFLRVLPPDRATSDTIDIILLGDRFVPTLGTYTSEAVKANVTNGLPTEFQPLNQLDAFATEFLRRIIEYELLPLNAQ